MSKSISEQGLDILRELGLGDGESKMVDKVIDPAQARLERALSSTKRSYDAGHILLATLFDVTESITNALNKNK
jgi:hypothetical protein